MGGERRRRRHREGLRPLMALSAILAFALDLAIMIGLWTCKKRKPEQLGPRFATKRQRGSSADAFMTKELGEDVFQPFVCHQHEERILIH